MSDRLVISAFMQRLVNEAGGVDAAASIIGARLGAEVSKGSVSKRLAGHLDWPLVEIMAIEDALGNPCVRRWLARSLPEIAAGQNLMEATAAVAKEHGEAICAAMAFASGRGDRARAAKEVAEALTATSALAAMIEASE